MIEIRNLVAQYGNFFLKEINLSILENECFVLVGPTGAGKTLFLETILGIKPPRKGQIFLKGRNITRISPEERNFSYLPQDLALFPHLSIKDNIGFGLKVKGLSVQNSKDKILSTAKMLKIDLLLNRKNIRSLSGGEKQRVALARAITANSKVLFLDEPFGALDTATRHELLTEFKLLQQRLDITIVLVTHDQYEAILLADKMAVIMDGRIKQYGSPEDVYEHPNSVSVAKFLMVENMFPVDEIKPGMTPKTLRCKVGDITVSVSSEVPANSQKLYLGIRAHYVNLKAKPSNENYNNWYKGIIENISGPLSSQMIRVKVGSQNTILIKCGPVTVDDKDSFHSGQQVFVYLSSKHLFFIREND